jgi:hypothetical protein
MTACLVLGGAWPSQRQQEPLRVGMIQPLSGPIAAAGSYIVNGAKIAARRGSTPRAACSGASSS